MALTIHDPGHIALRRGIRAAVALPLGLALALYVTEDVQGVLFTMFGIVGLLVNADFAGSVVERTSSYLLTGVAGTVAITVGWLASFNTAVATLTTVVVTFVLLFVNLLRGTIALGTPAVLLVFIVAVSLQNPTTSLPNYLYGWWLAVAVSLATALVLLPHNRRADLRAALAATFSAAARAAENTWIAGGDTAAERGFGEFVAAVRKLDDTYGGQPFRISGLSARDRAMTLLVDHVNSARLLLEDPDDAAIDPDALPVQARLDLVHAIIGSLDDLATAMTNERHLPSGRPIDDCRVRMTAAMEQWVLAEAHDGTDTAAIASRLGADHRMRMSGLLVEQMVELARIANGGTVEALDRRPPIPVRSRLSIVLSQMHPDSPWLRNSLRSAIGLGLAVLVVNITGVTHGFWVLLGVLSILRFDAVGTRKFALEAIGGTILGVVVATIVVVGLASQPWVLWVLLPPTVFLAAWSAAAVNFPIGQAAFTALILVAFSIVSWPPDPTVGLVRIEDIALGAGVALVVGLLMWPRGAVGYLRRELAAALRAGSSYMSTALSAFAGTSDPERLEQERIWAVHAAQRASETYDIALMQRGPVEDLHPWTTTTTIPYLMVSASRVISQFAGMTPEMAQHPELLRAIAQAQHDSQAHWTAVADAMGATPDPAGLTEDPARAVPTLAAVTTQADARALIIAVWIVDWVRHLDALSTGPARAMNGSA